MVPRHPLACTAAALLLATASPAAPLDTARAASSTGAQRFVVHAGGCSGAVLNVRSGSWVVTAAHCGAVRQVVTQAGVRFPVVARYRHGGATPTGDVMLLRVRGNVRRAVGGGFALGGTPARGSLVNVHGFPSGRTRLVGCSGLTVRLAYGRYPQVRGCRLPSGTSGGPWWTNDVVLHGVTGGLDRGGADDWTTNTVPFTPAVRSWVWRHVG